MRNRHINIKELEAVDRALETLGEKIKGRNIALRIDNQVAMAYVNRMTGRAKDLAQIARRIHERLERMEATIHAVYIASKDNVKADALSRERDVRASRWSSGSLFGGY